MNRIPETKKALENYIANKYPRALPVYSVSEDEKEGKFGDLTQNGQ